MLHLILSYFTCEMYLLSFFNEQEISSFWIGQVQMNSANRMLSTIQRWESVLKNVFYSASHC